MHRITHRKSLALVYYQAARYNDAQKVLAQIDALEPRELYWQKPVRFAIGALCELAQGNEATARELAKRSLQASRNGNCIGAFVQLRPWAPHFCEFALCHGIEADHVRELIRHYEWPPPSLDVENWPWQVKLQTLGEFVVLRRDVALQFGRKAPRKLLQLLRAIVAFGGKQVPEQRLLDSLWMEQDGDAAYRALAVAIRRLRDLFGSDAAIEHVDGKVSLDPGYVWVDAYAFERRADAGTDMAGRASALELYKGGFFAEEADERWALQYRERLRAKFLRLVQEQGSGLETAQDWDQAASCYAKGIESDDLAESFYQGLMRCQLQLGQRAHALSTYRRMRQLFSVVLGMAPSAESEALFRSLNAEP